MGIGDKLKEWRRYLHANPELSFHEYQTSQYLGRELAAMGIEIHYPKSTGVVGFINGKLPGPTVALRADIDALPLQDAKQVVYHSKIPGVMHACGHDGHCAILLGVAKTLSSQLDLLPGRVVLIFQPAEERPPGGALEILEQGYLHGAEWIFGLHLWAGIPAGMAGITAGPLMANSDEFTITVQGKGGHGSMPQDTVDSILVASQLVVALQSIVSRSVNPLEPAVVSVGTLHAGTAFNIIAQEAVIRGTYRSFSETVRERIESRIKQIAEGVCNSYGATCEVECHRGYPALVNPPEGVQLLRAAAIKVIGEENLILPEPVLGGEDFSYYLQRVPGAFMFLGADCGLGVPHHHPGFDFKEEVMETGVQILVQATMDALRVKK